MELHTLLLLGDPRARCPANGCTGSQRRSGTSSGEAKPKRAGKGTAVGSHLLLQGVEAQNLVCSGEVSPQGLPAPGHFPIRRVKGSFKRSGKQAQLA